MNKRSYKKEYILKVQNKFNDVQSSKKNGKGYIDKPSNAKNSRDGATSRMA